MKLKKLDVICYTVCISCIVAGIVFSLVIIWGEVDNRIAWKGALTIAVLFFGGILTISVNKLIEDRKG